MSEHDSQWSVPGSDPAPERYHRPYRDTDPEFADEDEGERWYAARRAAIDTVLAAIAGSPWARSLVLRGSILLRTWFGAAAREPGDLDFVVVPLDWEAEQERTTQVLDGIALAAERLSAGRDVRIIAQGAASDDIWTYDRVPGRRLVLPWEGSDGLPGGWIQLDFVFNERLLLEPVPTVIPRTAGAGSGAGHGVPDGTPDTVLLAATPELSLAWKVTWLVSDLYPRGKDLFDAVLLAEHTALRLDVLKAAFEQVEALHAIAELEVDWDEFVVEYPGLVRDGQTDEDHLRRLTAALAPTFVRGETRLQPGTRPSASKG